ncbi:hypothetical protein [Pelagibacterium luteolum]|uniref:Uncharacterized protein n=1 Tax=Pelagibacterium luteolum TaxID=440168 RepID=A0A1G8A605_9HYPH|nr:hypothetical protein [Pelagibacterium luteolum]SDH16369.1 hypothetical protein SAMN04487974_12626 [Pelagibacterium luteolum]
MQEWIANNSDVINALSSAAMLLVWLGYLQVFLHSYRRQIRPKIVINRAAGSTLDASCFVSNMSSDAIYIESVIVTLRSTSKRYTLAVTDLEELEDSAPADPRQRTLQGPLGSGDYTSIGTFGDLIARAERAEGTSWSDPENEAVLLDVTVIADHASEELLIGAQRRFGAEAKAGTWYVQAMTGKTQQIRSRRARKRIIVQMADVN